MQNRKAIIKNGLAIFGGLYLTILATLWLATPRTALSGCNPPPGECCPTTTTVCVAGSLSASISGPTEACPGELISLTAESDHQPGHEETTVVHADCTETKTTTTLPKQTPSVTWSVEPSASGASSGSGFSFTPGECGDYTVTAVFTVQECDQTLTKTVSHTITVSDQIFSVVADPITISCEQGWPDPSVTASNLVVNSKCNNHTIDFVGDSEPVGDACRWTITRTYNVIDSCGNAQSITQQISLIDTNPPVLTGVPGDVTVSCTNDYPWPVPAVNAVDSCGAATLTTNEVRDLDCGGTITRTWTASDECGNSTSAVQVITILPPLLSISFDPSEIGFGQTSQGKAFPCKDLPVTWSIIGFTPCDSAAYSGNLGDVATIDALSGKLEVSDDAPTGWLEVKATYEGCEATCKIEIKCGSCSSCNEAGAPGGTCTFGAAQASVSGGFAGSDSAAMRYVIDLGKTGADSSAGTLLIEASEPSPDLFTPFGLALSTHPKAMLIDEGSLLASVMTSDSRAEAIYDANGLRQVWVPEGLIDIIVESQTRYRIDVYKQDDTYHLGNPVPARAPESLYTPLSGKIASYIVENPNPLAGSDVLNIIEQRNGNVLTNQFTYNDQQIPGSSPAWSYDAGGGRYRNDISVATNGTQRTITSTISSTGGIASVRARTQQAFPWGEATVRTAVETGDGELATTYSYYTNPSDNGYACRRLMVESDGSWKRFDAYDTEKRVTEVVTPWGNADTSAVADAAISVSYSYAPVDPEDLLLEKPSSPRTAIKRILGTIVEKSFAAYYINTTGQLVSVSERAASPTASYGDAGNDRVETISHPLGTGQIESGRPISVITSSGRKDVYAYESGNWTFDQQSPGQSHFTIGNGNFVRIMTDHLMQGDHALLTNQSLRDVVIEDPLGRTVMSESYVYTGGTNYTRIGWTVNVLNDFGQVMTQHRSSGQRTDTTWGCCGKETEIDQQGLQTSYVYDDLDRVDLMTRQLGTNSIFTTYTYDAAGRRLTTLTQAGGISQSTSNRYSLAGQLVESVDQQGITTTYAYSSDGLTNTTIRAGLTNITVRFPDGRTRYTEQNGERQQTYDYGVNADGTQWTKVYTGPDGTNSPAWQRTTTDILGRTVQTERPGFDQSGTGVQPVIATENTYNTNGVIELAGPDRVSSNATEFVQIAGDYWRESRSYTYPETNSDTALLTGTQRQRLTGLGTQFVVPPSGGSPLLASETISIDLLGNQTIQQTAIDRDNKTVTQLVDSPTSTNDAVSVTINGLLIEQTSSTGQKTTYGYDALGRRISTTDPRTGTSVTHYNALGQVDYVEDAATNRTTFAYDPATGQRIATTDALSNTTHQAYSVEGQLIATWGATYPVAYAYDAYDRMTAMYTYRGTNEINSADDLFTLPTDRTTWSYDDATGLLTNKLYADNQGTSYTYTPDGKLATRTWARGITTTYSYDTCCGALTNISYSDDTPSVAYTYDRLGRQVTVTDAQGTRTNVYDASTLALVEEQLPDGTVLERSQDTYGRASGISLGDDYEVNYGYDGYGRFHSVSSAYSVVEYSYLEGSSLIESTTFHLPPSTFNLTRSYEPNRNLITGIENQWGTNLISSFAYENDAVGRRTKRIDNASITNAFGYNIRSEVIEALMGTNTYGYAYDPIGNRLSEVRELMSEVSTNLYTANALNQYSAITNFSSQVSSLSPSYDADGNMLTYGEWIFEWNGENRLVTASNATTVIENKYDYMGRRFQKTVNGETNIFLYDGWAMIQEQTSSATNSYVYGLDLSGSMQGAGTIGGILSMTVAGSGAPGSFYCYDANGNVTDLVDANGATVAHYEYGPFGGTIAKSGALADDNPFRFSTKYLDEEPDLYYYGLRYYSSDLGRWINRDPIEEEGGVNIYGFSENNPVHKFDLIGLYSC